MKLYKQILISATILLATNAHAQIFSNGFNTIAGSNVGVGTNSPASKLHVKSNTATYTIIQADATNSTAALRIQDATGSANELGISKFGSTVGGTFMGISRNSMSVINSLTGPLVFNGGGRVIFGTSLTVSPFTQNPRIIIDSFGKIYVGSTTDNISMGNTGTTPIDKVHISSTSATTNLRISNTGSGNTINDGLLISTVNNASSITNKENSTLTLGTNNATSMTLLANNSVLIGTAATPAGYKLYVQQGILTEKVKVALTTSANWADFVFADNYNLQPLSEVESFIKQHKHLPGVPSADEVVANGLDLATMDAKLLEKIEELTLHMIQLEKEVNTLKAQNNLLKSTK